MQNNIYVTSGKYYCCNWIMEGMGPGKRSGAGRPRLKESSWCVRTALQLRTIYRRILRAYAMYALDGTRYIRYIRNRYIFLRLWEFLPFAGIKFCYFDGGITCANGGITFA